MKEQEHLQQGAAAGSGPEKKVKPESITSDSVKNAHAAGDGAMERSLDSIPDEEDLKQGNSSRPQRPQQY